MRRIAPVVVAAALLGLVVAPAPASADLRFVDCLGVRGFPQPACSTPPTGYGLPGFPLVSRDGRHLYVGFGQRQMIYARNAETGALSYVSCVDHYEPTADCPEYTPNSGELVEAPDGRFLYSMDTYSLYWYARDAATGALRFAGCLEHERGGATPVDPRCSGRFRGLSSNEGGIGPTLAVSSDSRQLYATAAYPYEDFHVFDLDPATGAPTHRVCFDHEGRPGCTAVPAMVKPGIARPSPDGAHVYVQGGNLVVFDRDAGSGALTPRSCVSSSERYSPTGCPQSAPIGSVRFIDARRVVMVGSGHIAQFDRDPATGAFTLRACRAEARVSTSVPGGCLPDAAIPYFNSESHVTPDGQNVLVGGDYEEGSEDGALLEFALGSAGPVYLGCIRSTNAGRRCEQTLDGLGRFTGSELAPDGRVLYLTQGRSDVAGSFPALLWLAHTPRRAPAATTPAAAPTIPTGAGSGPPAASIPAACPPGGARCGASVVVTAAGASGARAAAATVLARGSERLDAGEAGTVTAKLTRAGTRALRRRRTVSARATVTLKRGARRTRSVLRLKLAR